MDSISAKELTLTFVSEKYPHKLIRHLKTVKKYQVKMEGQGIYYVEGDLIPIQIIVTRQLSETENLWLRSLTDKLKETKDAKKLIEDYLGHTKNNLYQSVMDTIIRANQRTFKEVNSMGDIFMEIVQEKFDKKLKEETDKNVKRIVGEIVDKAVEDAVKKATEDAVKKAIEDTIKKAEEKNKMARLTERISLIQKKYAKEKPLSVIADEMETVPDELLPIYNVICKNPDKTAEEVYELVFCH